VEERAKARVKMKIGKRVKSGGAPLYAPGRGAYHTIQRRGRRHPRPIRRLTSGSATHRPKAQSCACGYEQPRTGRGSRQYNAVEGLF
jgi:hypothetical protein